MNCQAKLPTDLNFIIYHYLPFELVKQLNAPNQDHMWRQRLTARSGNQNIDWYWPRLHPATLMPIDRYRKLASFLGVIQLDSKEWLLPELLLTGAALAGDLMLAKQFLVSHSFGLLSLVPDLLPSTKLPAAELTKLVLDHHTFLDNPKVAARLINIEAPPADGQFNFKCRRQPYLQCYLNPDFQYQYVSNKSDHKGRAARLGVGRFAQFFGYLDKVTYNTVLMTSGWCTPLALDHGNLTLALTHIHLPTLMIAPIDQLAHCAMELTTTPDYDLYDIRSPLQFIADCKALYQLIRKGTRGTLYHVFIKIIINRQIRERDLNLVLAKRELTQRACRLALAWGNAAFLLIYQKRVKRKINITAPPFHCYSFIGLLRLKWVSKLAALEQLHHYAFVHGMLPYLLEKLGPLNHALSKAWFN